MEFELIEGPETTALTEYSAVEAGLAMLRTDLSGVQFDVTTTSGDKAA